jgi:serine/threonine protein kinase
VYKVQHIRLDKILALKVLFEHTHQNPRMIKRFEREARATCRIGHDNIVEITDFSRDRSVGYYFVMEHLMGETLADRLRSLGPMDPARLIHVSMQIADALAATHAKGIVHRDLKPDNIFLVRKRDIPDFVKVLDFGIAAMSDLEEEVPRLTRHGAMLGTPAYMSPEQAEAKTADHRADIYSFGVVLYEMATGTVPFNNASSLAVLEMHRTTKPIPPRTARPELETPVEIEKIIMRALRKPLTERYQSMREMYNDMAQLAKQMDMSSLDSPLPRIRVDQPPALPPDDINAEEPEWLDEDLVLLDDGEGDGGTPHPTVALPNTPVRMDSDLKRASAKGASNDSESAEKTRKHPSNDVTVIASRKYDSTESRDTLSVRPLADRNSKPFWRQPALLIVLGFMVTLGAYIGVQQFMKANTTNETSTKPANKAQPDGQTPPQVTAAGSNEKLSGGQSRDNQKTPGRVATDSPVRVGSTKTTKHTAPAVVAGTLRPVTLPADAVKNTPVPRRTWDKPIPEQRRPNRPLEMTGLPPYVQITISSDPAGAAVYVNNKLRGVTPLALKVVPQDTSVPVEIRRKGYKTKKRTVVPNNNSSFHVKLTRTGGRKGAKVRRGGSTYDLWD